VVISPRIASAAGNCRDTLAANEVSWSCTGDSWRSGGVSASHPDLTSFDFIDQVLKKLANKQVFPNLGAIVVAGHSAGGQFVARYQMANRVHDTLGVPVTYVVANPSSYAWPDNTRPQPVDDGAPDNAKARRPRRSTRSLPTARSTRRRARTTNRWPAGPESFERLHREAERRAAQAAAVSRPTTFCSARSTRCRSADSIRRAGDGAGRRAARAAKRT
jgi:pimeloyl-ACP methyl ester carboxylesterase